MKILRIVFCLLVTALGAYGQTVSWHMKLLEYNEINRINNNLYQVVQNGKIGLIHADGAVVAKPENDAIGLFYDHKALVTCNDAHGERVAGCLTDDGQYYKFSNKYYTLNGQKFFSDDVLSVADENGNLGYVDIRGNVVLGFDGKYDKIKPFVEGYAAVFKKSKYYLIDKEGQRVHFVIEPVGEVLSGTNIYNGLAYVWDTDGKFYTYDVKRKGTCKKTKKITDSSLDYLFRFSSVTGLNKAVPFKANQNQGTPGLASSSEGGLYGYRSGETIILPYQLSSASQFEDGLAVVRLNGRMGLLKYVADGRFEVSASTTKHKFYAGNTITCSLSLSVPNIWQGKVRVEIKDGNGTFYGTKIADGNCSFAVQPTKTEDCNYTITVYEAEGELRLYETVLTYSFIKKVKCAECGQDLDICHGQHQEAKKEDKCPTCGKNISECKYQGVH